jgi:hypothetical protein
LLPKGLIIFFSKGIELGYFQGLGPPVIANRTVLNLQYADDTLLFLKADYLMVERIKWALRVFEGLSGLKINFHKSELVALNIDSAIARNFTLQLNCQVGAYPLKYLGLALH